MTYKHHTRLELVEGGNIFKQGDHPTLKFIAYDSLGNEVDLTNKQIEGALYSRNKGIMYEAPASFTDGRIVFTIDELLDNGKFQLEFTATDSADPDYRAKFPSDEYAAQLTIKPSKDNMDFVGVSMTTVAQLKGELQGLQTEFAGQVLPRVDLVEGKQLQLDNQFNEVLNGVTEDGEILAAHIGVEGTFDTIGQRMDATATQLAETVKYPILPGEVGVINKHYPYGDVKRHGAKGVDDFASGNDTAAFQNAIDSAYTLGVDVTVPSGQYWIRTTILLPPNITIRGISSQSGTVNLTGKCRIHTFPNEVFRPATGKSVTINMEKLMFQNRLSTPYAILFSRIDIVRSLIFQNAFYGYNIIVFGKISGVSTIQRNNIQQVRSHFILTYDDGTRGLSNVFSSTDPSLVDSVIVDNYFNGDKEKNVTMFILQGSNTSKILSNYIDFVKVGINSCNGLIISNNTFDYCYRAINGNITNSIIGSNSFIHIANSYKTSFTNPDVDMVNNEWIAIEPSIATPNRSTITSNQVTNCDKFLYITGYSKYALKITNNQYDDPTKEYIFYSVSRATWIPNDQKKIFIDDFMYKKFTTLPNPTLTAGDADAVKITTFDGQVIRYNGKILLNDGGQWRDSAGALVT